VPVPHEPGAPIVELQILPVGQERLHLQVHSLREQPPGAGAQHIRQGIVDVIGLTKAHDVGNLFHRRIALSERFWQAEHPPRYAAFAPSSSPSFLHSSQTWLSLSGEEAPDLLETAPVRAGAVRRGKIEAVGCLTLGIVALPLLYLATVSVAATVLSAGLGAFGLCTAVTLHLWHGVPARRSAFAARHRESKLMALIEMSLSLLFGLTTALSVLGTAWGLAPFAVVGAILLWLKPRGFPTEAGVAR